MGELLANLVFIAIALLAWVLKSAMERKEQKQAEQSRRPQGGGGGPITDSGMPSEVDVVYGRRKLPETLTAPPAPVSSQTPEPSLASGGLEERPLTMGGLPSAGMATAFDRPRRRRRPAATMPGGGDVPAAWARLGLPSGMAPRDAVRAGVLWSEVLAVPRAVQGPHRSPVVKRMQRTS